MTGRRLPGFTSPSTRGSTSPSRSLSTSPSTRGTWIRGLPSLVLLLSVLTLAGDVLAPGPAAAQEETREDTPAADQGEGVSFDFQDADLRTVLAALAEAAGVNIVYSDLPDRSVTLRTARPVPPSGLRDLLASVAASNGLELEERAGVVHVYRPAEPAAGETAAVPDTGRPRPGGPPRLFVHPLDHAEAETVAQTLRALFGLGSLPARRSGPRTDRTSLSERLREQSMADYRAFRPPAPEPQRAPAGAAPAMGRRPAGGEADGDPQGDGQEPGLSVALEAPVEIVPDPRSNAILVLARPEDYETVRRAIGELDVRPAQVLIEVLIAEVRQNDNFALGNSVDVPPASEDDGVGFELQGLSAGDVALRVLGIGQVGASTVLSALSTTSDVTILSRPVVMAQNNRESRILVGDQRPFVQLQRSLPTDQDVRDQVVQYRNVGTELRIRPTVNRDGYVNLSVLQEVSSATAEVQFGAPVINTRESETDVLVRDGHTVVLGGLVDHQRESTRSGIPLLKDIPVLGGLFGSTQEREIATELFILLTPHVLRTDEDLQDARRQLEGSTDVLRERLPEPRTLMQSRSGERPALPAPDTVPRPGDGPAPPP